MIHQMSVDVAADLQERKFPVTVVYGPERTLREAWHSALIVFERDREQGDTIDVVRGTQRNARRRYTRGVGVKVTVYAKSGVSGAMVHEHEREADAIVDGLVTQLDRWAVEGKAAPLEWTESRFLTPEEVDESELGAGAVYRLRFRVGRGVDERDYEGSAQPTGAATSTANAIEVSINGEDYEEV